MAMQFLMLIAVTLYEIFFFLFMNKEIFYMYRVSSKCPYRVRLGRWYHVTVFVSIEFVCYV